MGGVAQSTGAPLLLSCRTGGSGDSPAMCLDRDCGFRKGSQGKKKLQLGVLLKVPKMLPHVPEVHTRYVSGVRGPPSSPGPPARPALLNAWCLFLKLNTAEYEFPNMALHASRIWLSQKRSPHRLLRCLPRKLSSCRKPAGGTLSRMTCPLLFPPLRFLWKLPWRTAHPSSLEIGPSQYKNV
ncbi:hypothetical protein IF1G_07505 [Cordyceps javanica]|uniref:Uncharacterized protein n=1 Tax=Cordyceps javanica TaxID=43265 RepID=A0A545UWC9_9HYPO|nr:hypothetical protein IF1G_07505 [Cordyceps javanica]